MSTKKKSRIAPEKIALYGKLVATIPDIERKGADNPYTSINGNMFSLLHSPDGRLALRLPEDERKKFEGSTTLAEEFRTRGADIIDGRKTEFMTTRTRGHGLQWFNSVLRRRH